MKKNYDKAIEKAKEMTLDVKKRGQEALGDDALSFMDSLMSSNEILESDLRAETMEKKIKKSSK